MHGVKYVPSAHNVRDLHGTKHLLMINEMKILKSPP